MYESSTHFNLALGIDGKALLRYNSGIQFRDLYRRKGRNVEKENCIYYLYISHQI